MQYLFCLTEVLNGQEGWYLLAYVDILNSRNSFPSSLWCFESSLSNQKFGSFYRRPKQKRCRKAADLERMESSCSQCRSREITSVFQFRIFSFQPTQAAEQRPSIQSAKLSMRYQNFSGRTENKIWGNQTSSWLWAGCGSLTLRTTYFSTWKSPGLLRNTVPQWLDLNGTQGLRITEYGASDSSHGALMAVWHLVNSLLWNHCL